MNRKQALRAIAIAVVAWAVPVKAGAEQAQLRAEWMERVRAIHDALGLVVPEGVDFVHTEDWQAVLVGLRERGWSHQIFTHSFEQRGAIPPHDYWYCRLEYPGVDPTTGLRSTSSCGFNVANQIMSAASAALRLR